MKLKKLFLMSFGTVALGAGSLAEANTTYNWTWTTTISGNPAPDNTTWTPSTTTGDWCSGMTSASMSTYGNCARWGGSESPAGPLTNVLQMKAFSNTGTLPSGAGTGDYAIQDAYLSFWGNSGVGVVNRNPGGTVDPPEGATGSTPSSSAPEHSVDNNGRYDMVLLTFDRAVSLTGVDIGWSQSATGTPAGDSDITVMGFNSTGSLNDLVGQRYGALQSGWQLVGNYLNADTVAVQSVAASFSSRYWLVGAYNPLASGGSSSYAGNDYVKIRAFTAIETVGKVPEPSGAMLIAAVLGAGGWVTRKRKVPLTV